MAGDILTKHVDMLGLRARDKVTGLEGVIESVSFDLYGCVQVALRPPMTKEGDLKDGRWFDIQRVVAIDGGQRVMPVPSFKSLATPEGVHRHGPADKPLR